MRQRVMMRRWIFILFIGLIAIVVAVAVAAQVIFSTDLPRRLVLDALAEQTGLRFDASALETGWAGDTVLRDLTIALPLETDPFVRVRTLSMTHTDLIRLIVFRDPILNVAIVDDPEVWLRQDADGRWNLLEAAQIVEQRLANDAPIGEIPPLPKLEVTGAKIHIIDMTQRHVTYGAVDLRGEPIDALSWQFQLALENDVLAEGRLAPRAGWSHNIDFDFQDIHQLIAPWHEDIPHVLQAAGSWRGRVENASLSGTLALKPLRADDLAIEGEAAVHLDGPAVIVRPSTFVITANNGEPLAKVSGGTIVADAAGGSVAFRRLLIDSFGMVIEAEGGLVISDDAAWMTAKWAGHLDELQMQHEGQLQLRLEMPQVGWHVITANVHSHGAMPDATWESQWEIVGRGEDWNSISGSIKSPVTLIHTDRESINLAGLTARFDAKWPLVRLTQLDLPGALTRGYGEYDGDTGRWSLSVHARQWNIPGIGLLGLDDSGQQELIFDVRVQAAGTPEVINLDVLTIATPGAGHVPAFELAAGGVYVLKEDQPLQVRAVVHTSIDRDGLQANLQGDLEVTGIVQPLDLYMDGTVNATSLSWEGRALEDMSVPLYGKMRKDEASFESTEFALLDGLWRVQGAYDFKSNLAEATLQGQRVSLERVIHLIDAPFDLAGLVTTSMQAELPNGRFDALHLEGNWELTNLTGEGLHAATGSGRVKYADQLIRLEQMQLEQNGGLLAGRAELDLRRRGRVLAELTLADWSVIDADLGVSALLNGTALLDVDMLDLKAASGTSFDFRADVTLDEQPLGTFEIETTLEGRTATVNRLVMTGLGGRAEGSGVVVLSVDQWHTSQLDLSWWDIDLARMPLRIELDHDIVGIATGTLQIKQATGIRAPEPLLVNLTYQLADASYGPFSLNDGFIIGYLGEKRLMLQESQFEMAGGSIGLWGRVTRHEGQPFTHVHLQINDIDLQQFANAVGFTDYPMPGRVNGEGTAGGYFTYPHRLFGQANLMLSESDIASAPGIAQLYSAANIDFGRPEPSGVGEVLVRLENNTIDVARLTYFNRGMDIVARARVLNIWEGADSPIVGLAAGTVRPLRDTRLPFIGDNLDRVIRAIQANAISVRINGTVSESQVSIVPLAEVTGALTRILRGRID